MFFLGGAGGGREKARARSAGSVISVICYLMRICVCTSYYCELVVGLRAQFCTVRGVGGLGIRMLTLDTKTSLYAEDRGLQVPMVLEHDYIPHTYNPHTYHVHTQNCGDRQGGDPLLGRFN
jgi:hypothetical protein